ncbi:hypothetical protein BX667DRAFT_494500 [Coemansia mojavensis]|nr:hypothetical protein BX667DRAFT_494500 [Coemansia mojavensis]
MLALLTKNARYIRNLYIDLIPLTLTAPQLSNELTFLQMSISSKAGHQIPLVYRDSLKHLSLMQCASKLPMEVICFRQSIWVWRTKQRTKHTVIPQTKTAVSSQMEFIDNLEVNIEAGAIDNPRYFFRHTNMLFGNKCLAQNSSLTLGELPNIPHMNALNWSRMTSLTIIYQLEVRQLLVLLEKMPSLTKLSVLSLDVGSLPASIANEKHVKKYKCAENNTLTFAKLNAVNVKPCGPNYLAFIRYFVLKYASLEHLCVSPSALFYTRALVEAYSQVCPHLATTGVFASSELY